MSPHHRKASIVLLSLIGGLFILLTSIWPTVSGATDVADTNYLPLVQRAQGGTSIPGETPLPSATPIPTSTPTNTATPTSTPSPTPSMSPTAVVITCSTPAYFYYCDDFEEPDSGWPVFDHTQDPFDCSKAYYDSGEYRIDICRDRLIRMLSPLVSLPDDDYSLEVRARFRENNRWWTGYGIAFEAASDSHVISDTNSADYYLLWVLWEDHNIHKWQVLKAVPGDMYDVTPWETLPQDAYNYGNDGLAWNTWRIERTATTIKILVNDSLLAELPVSRPDVNTHNKFGLYSAVYETDGAWTAFDYFIIDH